MSHHHDDHFEQRDESEAIHVYPRRVGALKKGEYAILKTKPCKIIKIMVSKNGKHGHAKAVIFGADIFTGKKYEDIHPTSHNIDCPFVKKEDFAVVDIQDDEICSYMDEEGEILEISLPEDEEFVDGLVEAVESCDEADDDKACYIVILRAMGREKIVDYSIKIDK